MATWRTAPNFTASLPNEIPLQDVQPPVVSYPSTLELLQQAGSSEEKPIENTVPANTSEEVSSEPNSDPIPNVAVVENSTSQNNFKRNFVQEFFIFIFDGVCFVIFKDFWAKKIQFLLGFLSCFAVVFFCVIAFSIMDQVPLILLRLAENRQGQYDLSMNSIGSSMGQTLNYNVISSFVSNVSADYSYNSPRHHFDSSSVFSLRNCDLTLWNRTRYGDPFDTNLASKAEAWRNWIYRRVTNVCDEYSCTRTACSSNSRLADGVLIITMDTEKERKMGLGREWPFPEIKNGHAIISDELSSILQVSAGDIIFLNMELNGWLVGPYREANVVRDNFSPYLKPFVPFVVQAIYTDPVGKHNFDLTSVVFVEYKYFLNHTASFMDPRYVSSNAISIIQRVDLYNYARYVMFNQPPSSRLTAYSYVNYDAVQNAMLGFISSLIYYVGTDQVETGVPILEGLRSNSIYGTFTGVLMDIAVATLVCIAIFLVYTLLTVNVENRTFELAIYRMIGMKRIGLILIIFLQGLAFAIPSIFIGLVLGQIFYIPVAEVLRTIISVPVPYLISLRGLLIPIALGLLIPIIASILPTLSALKQNLHDGLDSNRPRTKAVKIKISRSSENGISIPLVVFGGYLAIFGFAVYYFFPLTLLSLNFSLLSYLLFAQLLVMLFGLVLLGTNIQSTLQLLIISIFFFYERPGVKNLTIKNLINHKERNTKTFMLFSLSLAFCIFLTVGFQVNITTQIYDSIRKNGATVRISFPMTRDRNLYRNYFRDMEAIIKSEPSVLSFGYLSYPLSDSMSDRGGKSTSVTLTSYGRYVTASSIAVRAASPKFYRSTKQEYLKLDSEFPNNGYFIDEKLYSRDSTGRVLMGTAWKEKLGLTAGFNSPFALEISKSTDQYPLVYHSIMKPLAFANSAALTYFSSFGGGSGLTSTGLVGTSTDHLIVSFPQFVKLSNQTVSNIEDVPINYCLVEMQPNTVQKVIDQFKNRIRIATRYYGNPTDTYRSLLPITTATTAMTYLLIFINVVAIVLCSFSLVSSMYTNIQEQVKEIAILRSIGTSNWSIYRVYFYEAFSIILSASLVGILIGVFIAYTLSAQRNLFDQNPLLVTFPWEVMIIVIVLGAFFAFISTTFPLTQIFRQPIVRLLRKV